VSVRALAAHARRYLDPAALCEVVGVAPDPWQERALRSTSRELLFLVHRQGGKSLTAGLLGLHTALYRSGSTTLIVSPGERQSKELLRRVTTAYRQLGRPLGSDAESTLTLELETGSRIIALPGSEATIRTYSADLLILEEASRIPDEVYHAVRPMVTITRGRMVAITTPFGKRGWFHEAWTDARQPWERYTASGVDCPRLSGEDLEAEWRAMGDFVFRQEYLCRRLGPGRFVTEPDPFVDTVNQIFPTHLLDAAMAHEPAPLFPVAVAPARRTALLGRLLGLDRVEGSR
jgi:hypothetical protein